MSSGSDGDNEKQQQQNKEHIDGERNNAIRNQEDIVDAEQNMDVQKQSGKGLDDVGKEMEVDGFKEQKEVKGKTHTERKEQNDKQSDEQQIEQQQVDSQNKQKHQEEESPKNKENDTEKEKEKKKLKYKEKDRVKLKERGKQNEKEKDESSKEKDKQKDKGKERDKNKQKDRESQKHRKRSMSPVATKEDLKAKKIQLIIYVGNLPRSWNEDDIRKFFEKYGRILDTKLIRKNFSFTGSALVKFASLSDAQDAIQKLKNEVIPGAAGIIKIKWLDTEEQRLGLGQNDDHKLFVGSLPRQASRETLFQVFSLLGEIETVRLEDSQYWAFVDYEKKESALLAIKYLNGQTFLHGSRIPIQVRFKERKYNSFMAQKHAHQDDDPFAYSLTNVYREYYNDGQHYYYNFATKQTQFEAPPPGAKVINSNAPDTYYIQQEVNTLNDMVSMSKKLGPPGSNLFLFHLPNNMKDSELYNLFKRFGKIQSTRVMTERNGKSKGIGFVSYDNPSSAKEAIEEMNGYEVRGKRLKVELNKKDEKANKNQISSLAQVHYDIV